MAHILLIEARFYDDIANQLAEAAIAELERVDRKVANELTVSNAYMPNVYDLRTHIQYIIEQVEKRKARLTG